MTRVTKHSRCLEVCEIYYNAGKSGLKSDIPRWIFEFIQRCPQIEVFRLWSPSGDCGGLDNKCIAAMVAGWVCLQHLELTGEAITLDGVILLKACSGLKTARLSHISLGARRRFESPQPSRSGVLTSRLYELTLDAPPNQEFLFVPAKSSKKIARAQKVDGELETYEEPPSPGWAELKAQCERMEEEDRRITSIDLTHIPESDTEADSHGLHGSRRRRGKDADGVVMYGLGWQPSRDVERSNGPDHEVEIELLPQRSEPKEGGGGLKEEVKRARKSHRRQQSCPTDYCLAEQTERADRTQRERVERVERTERDQGTEEKWSTQGSLPSGLLAGSSGVQWEGACMQEQEQQQQLQHVDVENRNTSERSAWQEGELSQVRSQQQRRGKLSLFATWHSRTRSRAEEFQSAVMSLSPPPPLPSSLPSSPPPAFSSPQPPSIPPATRHRRCSSGVLQPTYALTEERSTYSVSEQQPSPSLDAGTQSSRGRESRGVQQEARLSGPLGSRLNPHFKPCQPGPPQQGASDGSAASASFSESPFRLQYPSHKERPPCQPCQVPPALLGTHSQGGAGQGPSGEGAFEQVSGRLNAPPGNAPESWQQVMEERVREAFALGYLAGLRDAAARAAAPPAAAALAADAATGVPAAVAAAAPAAAAGASPGQFLLRNSSSDSGYVTSHSRERAAHRMCKTSTVSGSSHCQDRSPLRWMGEVRMPLDSTQTSSTVSGGGSHSHGGSPLGWNGEGEVQMPHRSHTRLKGPLQARRVASGPLQPRSGPLKPRSGPLQPRSGPLQPRHGLVLTSLVANGVFPDPLHGINTRDCIPDIAHTGRPFYTFLFRRCLHLPSRKVPAVRCCLALLHCQQSGSSVAAAGAAGAAGDGGAAGAGGAAGDKGCCGRGDCSGCAGCGCERVEWERVWLCFRGVNYSLAVFLNSRQLSIDQPAGMFLRRQLDITDVARRGDIGKGHCSSKGCSSECSSSSSGCGSSESRNHLAVVVNPVDHPGNVDGGGQGGDHQVAKDVTAQYVEGWDWIIPIRDRNTGMWDQVHVAVTGPVTIGDPHLVAVFASQRCNDTHADGAKREHADGANAKEDVTHPSALPHSTHTCSPPPSSSSTPAPPAPPFCPSYASLHCSLTLTNSLPIPLHTRLSLELSFTPGPDQRGGAGEFGRGGAKGCGGEGGEGRAVDGGEGRTSGEGEWEEEEEGFVMVEGVREEEVEVPACSSITHTFRPLLVSRPHLWWPNGMGAQSLYGVAITACVLHPPHLASCDPSGKACVLDPVVAPHTTASLPPSERREAVAASESTAPGAATGTAAAPVAADDPLPLSSPPSLPPSSAPSTAPASSFSSSSSSAHPPAPAPASWSRFLSHTLTQSLGQAKSFVSSALYGADGDVGKGESGEQGEGRWIQSDVWSSKFGFRQIDSYVDEGTGGRVFFINGCPLFIRGTNWIVSDAMLRLSAERYWAEMKLFACARVNMIRVWAGALMERPDFYDACDRLGILVWQEFWITGDCNGRGLPPSDPSWPLDHRLFLACAEDSVRLLRNHASLALWVGGNETVPAADLNDSLKSLLRPYDAESDPDPSLLLDGTRAYIEGSLWGGFADSKGGWTDGPYGIQNPEDFFCPDYYPYAFNPEIGSVGVPEAESLRVIFPESDWSPPVFGKGWEECGGECVEEESEGWKVHTYIPYGMVGVESDGGGEVDRGGARRQPGRQQQAGVVQQAGMIGLELVGEGEETRMQEAAGSRVEWKRGSVRVKNQILTYGPVDGLDDFCDKAQIANYLQYRSLFEAWSARMWERYTGVLLWKGQNPWGGLRGQLYDHLLAATGGLYGTRCALEAVHVQLDLHTGRVQGRKLYDHLLATSGGLYGVRCALEQLNLHSGKVQVCGVHRVVLGVAFAVPWAAIRPPAAPTGGLYGVRCALEPVHVQVNLHSGKVQVCVDSILLHRDSASGEEGTGSGEEGTGSGEEGTGSGEEGTGSGEEGTGSGEEGTGSGAPPPPPRLPSPPTPHRLPAPPPAPLAPPLPPLCTPPLVPLPHPLLAAPATIAFATFGLPSPPSDPSPISSPSALLPSRTSSPAPSSPPSAPLPSYAYLGDFRALGGAFRQEKLRLSLSFLRLSSASSPGEAGRHLPPSEPHGGRSIWWRAYLLVSNPVKGGALGGKNCAERQGEGGGAAVGVTGPRNDPAAGVNGDESAGAVAFFVRFNVRRRVDGKRVLPAVYSENYLSLLPGEEVTVQVEFAHEPCSACARGSSSTGSSCSGGKCDKGVFVEMSGWNVCTSSCDVPLLKP
ncbi:unnamed protein product [Closterium sp. Naga37s-1]|nr:unnamed protein product [Closterium sp. Naga37s-1]